MPVVSVLKRVASRCLVITNVVCIFHCFSYHVADFTVCIGPSMIPAINNRSNVTVVVNEHISAKKKKLQRGDIVIAKSLTDPDTFVCKRIYAVAGESVSKPDDYDGDSTDNLIRVPRGHVWLLGDNAENSLDSRYYGPVPQGLITGRVCFRIWPLAEIGPM